MNALNSADEMGLVAAPTRSRVSRTAGVTNPALSAPLNVSTMAGDVFAGASTPVQNVATCWIPLSVNVGTSEARDAAGRP